MKARIPTKLTKQQEYTLRREATKQCIEVHEEYEHTLDTVIAYTLHTELGFGRKRIQDFFNAMAGHLITIKHNYSGGSTDDAKIAPYIMEKKLRDDGIDINEIISNMEKYATDTRVAVKE